MKRQRCRCRQRRRIRCVERAKAKLNVRGDVRKAPRGTILTLHAATSELHQSFPLQSSMATAPPPGLRPPALIEAVLHVLSAFSAGGDAQISAIYKAGGFKLATRLLSSAVNCGYSTSYGVVRACFSLLSHCAGATKYASIMGKDSSSPCMVLLRAPLLVIHGYCDSFRGDTSAEKAIVDWNGAAVDCGACSPLLSSTLLLSSTVFSSVLLSTIARPNRPPNAQHDLHAVSKARSCRCKYLPTRLPQ